jgi:hypothetical protein
MKNMVGERVDRRPGLAFGICKKFGTFRSFGAQDSWIEKERGKSVVCTLVLKT